MDWWEGGALLPRLASKLSWQLWRYAPIPHSDALQLERFHLFGGRLHESCVSRETARHSLALQYLGRFHMGEAELSRSRAMQFVGRQGGRLSSAKSFVTTILVRAVY